MKWSIVHIPTVKFKLAIENQQDFAEQNTVEPV
jgi:hypothetical protein